MSPSRNPTDRVVCAVSLREYEESAPIVLDADARAVLLGAAGDRFSVLAAPDPNHVVIRASSWVGAMVLPGLNLRVRPKVGLRNLFTLFSAGLPESAWRAPDVGWEDDEDPVDGIAEFVVRAIDETTRRGLLHGYLDVEERTPAIRGRLLVEQLATRPWDVLPPPCRYDKFTADVVENRWLRLGLHRVLRWPQLHPSVRRRTLRVLQRFDGVSDVSSGSLPAELPRSTRLNEHYRPALELARLVVEGTSFTDLPGQRFASSLMVDMNDLFERWVAAELRQRLWPGIEVATQVPKTLADHGKVRIRPDLVFRHRGKNVLVGDTKYKLTADARARSGDYFQMLAYAVALDVRIGLLIYCTADDPPPREVVVRHLGTRLQCLALRLDGPPEGLDDELERLCAHIRRTTTDAST